MFLREVPSIFTEASVHEISNGSVVLMPKSSTSLESTFASLAKMEVMKVLEKNMSYCFIKLILIMIKCYFKYCFIKLILSVTLNAS